MTKYELAKLFSEVDDKYIESARPEPQKAVMLKTRKTPMRIVAAASCAAVLAGGVITVTALRKQINAVPDNSNTASITSGSADITSSAFLSNEKNWFNTEQIYYEGEYYTVIKDASECGVHITCDEWRAGFALGVRISAENTVDLVAVIKNKSDEPIGMYDAGDGSGIRLGFHKKPKWENPVISGIDVEKHVTKVLQPGEELYQKQSFELFYGECWGSFQYDFGDPDGGYIQTWQKNELVFTGEITGDGFKEHNGNYDWYTKEQIYYAGKYYKVMPDPAFGFDYPDSVGIMMGIRKTEQNTIDVVAVVKNNFDKPVEIEGDDFGLIYEMTLEPKPEQKFTESDFKDIPDKPQVIAIKPGAVCYQWKSFDLFYGEFMGKWQISYKNPNSGNRIESRGVYYGEMTEDGFKEIKPDDTNSQDLFNELMAGSSNIDLTIDEDNDGIPDELKRLNPDITDEQWEIYKKLAHPEENGLTSTGEDSSAVGKTQVVTNYYTD